MKRLISIMLAYIMLLSLTPSVGFAAGKPSAPSVNSYSAVSNSSIKIRWGKVSGATKYRVDRRKSGEENYKTLTKDCTSTSYTDSGLKSGSTYFYRVYAINSAGMSTRSLTCATSTKPDRVVIASVDRDSETQLTIKWNSVQGATKYKITYRRGDQADYQTLVTNVTGTAYTHKGLTPNARYWYRVYAVREADIGPEGARSKKNIESDCPERMGNFTKIARPSNTTDLNNPNIVTLSWKQAYGNNDYSYDIYRKAPTDSGFIKIKRTKDLTYTDIGLTPGVIYKYKINTIANDTGASCTWCDEFYAAPRMTKGVVLTPQSASSMKINWDKPIGGDNLKYVVRKWNGSSYDHLPATSNTYYIDTGLKTGETYRYYVDVRDASNIYLTNTIAMSEVLQILPTGVSLNKTSISAAVGETINLSAAVVPNNSTNKSVSWSSSNTNVLSVSSAGAVTAKKLGSAVITVTTSNGKSASCNINVSRCEHAYGNWTVSKQETCSEQGKRIRVCSKCGESENENIPMSEHSYKEEITEAGCVTDGSREKVCIKCNYRTEKEIIPAAGHSYPEEWLIEKEADCKSEGLESRQCTVCNEKETRVTEKKQHKYELISETEPTASKAGERKYKCSDCGGEYTDVYWPEKSEGIISIESKYAKVGETILIPVTIDENPGMSGFRFKITFDRNAFEPASTISGGMKYVSPGGLLKDEEGDIGSLGTNLDLDKDNYPISVVWNNITKVTGNGELFYIALKVKSTAELGDYPIEIECESASDGIYEIVPDIINGSIAVVDFLPGDINKDGKIDARDGTLLSQHLAGWTIARFTEPQIRAADLYKDDKITIKDSVRFVQLWSSGNIIESKSEISLAKVLRAPMAYSMDKKAIVKAGEVCGAPGEYVDVPITISDNSGIAGFDLKIDYDKNKLIPAEIIKGDILSQNITSNLQEESIDISKFDFVTACCSDMDNESNDGVLCTVRFLIKDNVNPMELIPVEINQYETSICKVSGQSVDDAEVIYVKGGVTVADEPLQKEYLYKIENVILKTKEGGEAEKPIKGDIYADINFQPRTEAFAPAAAFAAGYDSEGRLVNIGMKEINESEFTSGNIRINIDKCRGDIDIIKIFIWDSESGMKPLAEDYKL